MKLTHLIHRYGFPMNSGVREQASKQKMSDAERVSEASSVVETNEVAMRANG